MSIVGTFMVPHPPLIIPEIGRGGEKEIELTNKSYLQVADEISKLTPDTIIISSPHTKYYSDYFHIVGSEKIVGNFGKFGASSISFDEENDLELVEEIEKVADKYNFPAGRTEDIALDHGSMVPLYFIRKKLPKCKIVIVGLSSLPLADNYKFGMIIKEAVNNLSRKVVYVASGDLSHKLQTYGPYGFIEEGPVYDDRIMKTMSSGNFNELLEYDELFLEKAAECGHRSFTIMAGALDGINVKSTYLSHQDVTGVGYGICTFYPQEENKERCFLDKYLDSHIVKESDDEYVRLAVASLTSYIKDGKKIEVPDNLPSEMINNKNGVFVSIHKFGVLRGCIGTFLPTKNNIAEEIIENAISASTRDPRFPKIEEDELKYLEVNVDVLETPTPCKREDLDPKRYGVIVSSGFKRGLLLPDLDGIDTVEQQISIAKRKANIGSNEEISLQRFEVIRHK
jgi:AmmeMemoRadiSam system protein A/AmmeMemoRadiSam system protein B